MEKKRIFVTGITGNQGGAVTKHLLDTGHEVIGLTRDANSDKAQYWKSHGVTIVDGNLNESSTYQEVMNKTDAVYFVQSLQKKNSEIQQGKQFIDAVKLNDGMHLVYASVVGADLKTGIPHFDSKKVFKKNLVYCHRRISNCRVATVVFRGDE